MKKTFKTSISTKILFVPLLIMFLIIAIIASISIGIFRSKILSQMHSDGINIASQVANNVERSNISIDTLDESFNSKISTLGSFIASNSTAINDDYLKFLGKQFEIDEINFTDASGKIIYSNLPENIGYVYDSSSAGYSVLKGEKYKYMENARKSTTSNDFYKYGYVKISGGGMVQIGILANNIANLTNKLKIQTLIDEMVSNNSMVYALYMNKELKIEAHSDKTKIGTVSQDAGSKSAAVDGKAYSSEFNYQNSIPVYDVIVPVHKDNQVIGAVEIGMSMKNVQNTIYNTIILIAAIAIVSFIILALILIKIASGITVPLKHLVNISKKIADGELNNEINIKSSDEIGVLASSFKNMQNNLKDTMSILKDKAFKVNTMSTALSSNSQDMNSSTSGVAKAIQDVAQGAMEQAADLSNVSNMISKFVEELGVMNDKLSKVNESSSLTEVKATKGREEIDSLLKSIIAVNTSFDIVSNKISNLNFSVSKVGNITNVIDEISAQTNLLALNASIEAARAGEAGKGFAVVADEIRKLAEQSKNSTEQIHELIKDISNETGNVILTSNNVKDEFSNQSTTVKNTINSFKDMLSAIKAIAPLVNDTYKAIEVIMKSKDTILEKVDSLTAISQETSASSEEISASSEELYASSENVANFAEELSKVADELNEQTNRFNI